MAFVIELTRLQPSQLYICSEKLDVVVHAASEGEPSDPVPVKELDGRLVMTDGHTRAVAAHLAGSATLEAEWDEDELDWDAYRECVRWCLEEGVLGVAALARRVVPGEEYETLWIARCHAMQAELDKKRRERPR